MRRRVVLVIAIAFLLIGILPLVVDWIRGTSLTLQHGTELAETALRFEVITGTSSGSAENYYHTERPRFGDIATGVALAAKLDFWDSVWSGAPENGSNLYLVTQQRLSNVRVIEYDGIQAKILAQIHWHQQRINRSTMLVEDDTDAGADRTYWFVFEGGVWKVSDFESTGPVKQ